MGTAMRRAFVDTPDGQMHYRDGGSGKSLLLLHQTPRSSNEYQGMVPILVQKGRIIAVDTMGYGDSDKPARPYSLQDYAETVVMLLDALGIGKASLAGHHTGAFIAAEVAASHPERVENLILSAAFHLNEQTRQWLLAAKHWSIADNGSHLMDIWQQGMERLRRPLLVQQRLLDTLKAGDSPHATLQAVAKYKQEERYPLIQCPTLLIYGTEDLAKLDSYGLSASRGTQEVQRTIRRCKVVIVPGGSSQFPTQMPDIFAHLILDFLRDATQTPM